MGKKLKLYTGGQFSSIAASPLGQVISHLKNRITAVLTQESQNKAKPSLEYAYSIKQLTVIDGYLKKISHLLSFFESGNVPGALSLPSLGLAVQNLVEETTDFDTPAFAFYREVTNDFSKAVANSLKKTNIKTIDLKNIENFKTSLKAEFRLDVKERFAAVFKIPGHDLNKYFIELDQQIDLFDFIQLNTGDHKDLFKTFSDNFFSHMFGERSRFLEAVEVSLSKSGIKQFDNENIKQFRQLLSDELRKYLDEDRAAAAKIPGFNLDEFYQARDKIIEEIDLMQLEQCQAWDIYCHLIHYLKVDNFNSFNHRTRYQQAGFQVTDPIVYNLAVEALELLQEAPADFNQLASFLNPQAVKLDFRSGVLAKFAPDRWKVLIEHTPTKKSQYSYTITKGSEEKPIVKTLDIAFMYNSRISSVKEQFVNGLAAYFRDYAETPHVKSELAKSELITQFVEIEKCLDKQCFHDAEAAEMQLHQKNRHFLLSPEDKLNYLTKLRQTYQNSHRQIADLQNRKKGYDSKPVEALMASYPQLAEKIQKAQAEGLDLGFCGQLLPDLVISKNAENNFTLLSVQQSLSVNETKYNNLLEKNVVFVKKIAELDEQISLVQSELQAQELAKHQENNQQYIKQLARLIQSAEHLNQAQAVQLPTDIEERLAVLSQEIELLTTRKDEVSVFIQEVRILQETINNGVECPKQVKDYDPSFVEKANNCYQPASAEAKNSLKQLEHIDQNFAAKKEQLLIELNKAKTAKVLSETMKSSDPSIIIALKDEKQKQRNDLQPVLQAHISELARKQEVLDGYKQLLNRVYDPLTNPDPSTVLEQEKLSMKSKIMKEFLEVRALLAMFSVEFDPIFSADNLDSSEGCLKAQEWLKTFLDRQQALLEKSGNSDIDQEKNTLLMALQQTKQLISEHKEGIPFKVIDSTLNSIFNLSWFSSDRGFDVLLDTLAVAQHSKEVWDKHRKSDPNDESVVLATISLLELIDSQITKCKGECRLKLSLQIYSGEFSKLQSFSRHLQQLTTSVSDFEQAISLREQSVREAKTLGEETLSLSQQIAQEQGDIAKLEESAAILDKIANLLTGNQELNKQIGALDELLVKFTTAALLNSNQQQLNDDINTLKVNLKELERILSVLKTDVNLLSDKAIYQKNIDKISSLLDDCKLKIDEKISQIVTIKLTELNGNLNSAEQALALINAERVLQAQNPNATVADKLDAVTLLLPKVNNHCKNVQKLVDEKGFLAIDEQVLDNKLSQSVPTAKTLKIQTEATRLRNEVIAEATSLIDTLTIELSGTQNKINLLHANEAKESQVENEIVLAEARNSLFYFPEAKLNILKISLNELPSEQSTPILAKLTKLIALYKPLKSKVDLKSSINDSLEVRIVQRERLASKFSDELTRYLETRNRKYAPVDLFYDKDANERGLFITKLKAALSEYAKKGGSQLVFDAIAEKNGPFLGFNLQPIINRILLEIKDLAKTVPLSYEVEDILLVAEPASRHNEALDILEGLNANSPEFVAAISDLYNKIGSINNFAGLLEEKAMNDDSSTAKTLALALRTRVDSLLINNANLLSEPGNSVAKKSLLENFQVNFICQLHSQNDVLSRHYSWAPLVANIVSAVLAVVTLGISAGFTALATKLITGHASLFFKPDGIACVDAIDKAVHGIAAPTA